MKSDKGRMPLGLRIIDWVLTVFWCHIIGDHCWCFDWTLHVPYYGTGHEQCVDCGLIRVKP